MSCVFVCPCGRKTTESFVVRDQRLCLICAEDEEPEILTRREKTDIRKFRDATPHRKAGSHRV